MLDFKNKKNFKTQGLVGVGSAIDWFIRNDYVVSIPINDNQGYDLIVKKKNKMYRVQVKTTYYKSKYGIYRVHIRTNGGNRSRRINKLFDKENCDLLYVLTECNTIYLIPTKNIYATTYLSLGKDKESYKIF